MVKVLSRGPITGDSVAAFRAAPLGRAIVLVGSGGRYQLLTHEKPVSRLELMSLGFKEYLAIDLSVEVLKSAEKVPSADPSVAFDLEIEITARLEDPLAFITKFGLETSLFEPFYRGWLSDIKQEISRFGPDNLPHVQQTLASLQSGVASRSPVIHGVRVLGFISKVRNDGEYERAAILARATMLLRNYGPEAVYALKEAHPGYAKTLETLLSAVHEVRDDRSRFIDAEWDRKVARVTRLYEEGVIDREERKAFLSLGNLKAAAQLLDGEANTLLSPSTEPKRLPPLTLPSPSSKQDMPPKE